MDSFKIEIGFELIIDYPTGTRVATSQYNLMNFNFVYCYASHILISFEKAIGTYIYPLRVKNEGMEREKKKLIYFFARVFDCK